jgi:tRNA(Ile)-lysidine synthetase-like protein
MLVIIARKMKPFTKVRRYIERHAMFAGARGVVVAVSGGPDSIALLDMLMRLTAGARSGAGGQGPGAGKSSGQWSVVSDQPNTEGQSTIDNQSLNPGPRPPAPGPRLHIAHLNHKLRGADSDADAEFVRRLADSLGLSVTIDEVDVRAAAQSARRGIEEAAREIRYNFLLLVAQATGSNRIATGHTISDQAETFLMRLARGSGARGLAAMRPVCPAHEFAGRGPGAGGQGSVEEEASLLPDGAPASFSYPRPPAPGPWPLLIRPLLCITRDEVEAYCDERGLTYRIDATNAACEFTRNRVRRQVLPALRAINPQVVEAIARAAEHLAADEGALDELAKNFLDAARVELSAQSADETIAVYRVAAFKEPPAGLQRRMLIEATRRAVIIARDRKEITAKHIATVQSLLDEKMSGKRVQLPGELEVWREFDALVFKRRAEAAGDYLFELSAAQSQVEAGGLRLTIERGLPASQLPSLFEQVARLKAERGRDWLMAILDDEALPACLIVRPRPRGARVAGQRKTIKLKKLMIDHTIPVSRRAAWPVVMTTDNRYVWSPGLPPAIDFAARDETRCLAIVRASEPLKLCRSTDG